MWMYEYQITHLWWREEGSAITSFTNEHVPVHAQVIKNTKFCEMLSTICIFHVLLTGPTMELQVGPWNILPTDWFCWFDRSLEYMCLTIYLQPDPFKQTHRWKNVYSNFFFKRDNKIINKWSFFIRLFTHLHKCTMWRISIFQILPWLSCWHQPPHVLGT